MNDIKVRVLSDRKIMMVYKINVVCFGTIVDTLKVYSIYSKEEDSTLKLKRPKERFFNKISMKFSISKSGIKYKYTNKSNYLIEGVDYKIPEFLSEIVIDNVRLIAKVRDAKIEK